jgi:hypothetical protein
MDRPLEFVGQGAFAVYHEHDPNTWSGPTDFYVADFRAYMSPTESKTWAPMYLWADPNAYTLPTMSLSIEPATDAKPPTDRVYSLELLHVPPGVTGAPPVGTVWEFPGTFLFTVEVPTFKTNDGLEGYQFALKVWPAACAGDITGAGGAPDGVTDLSDLATLLGSYGLCKGDPGYDAAADLTGGPGGEPDDCVDLQDLADLLGDYGCSTTP